MKIKDKIRIELGYMTLFESVEELKSMEKKYGQNLLIEMDEEGYYIEILREATQEEENKLKQKELRFLYKDIEKYPNEALIYLMKLKKSK